MDNHGDFKSTSTSRNWKSEEYETHKIHKDSFDPEILFHFQSPFAAHHGLPWMPLIFHDELTHAQTNVRNKKKKKKEKEMYGNVWNVRESKGKYHGSDPSFIFESRSNETSRYEIHTMRKISDLPKS